MKKCLLFAFMTIMGLVCCHGQDFAQYKQNLDWQVFNYPQEKIHVMTDKPYYITGDTIWLRAFVVNAVNHQPVDASKFVYVELISPMNEVSMRIKIKERDGVFEGFLPLDPTKIAEGEYTLTAYTMFMQNQGEQYFFKKKVKITSSFAIKRKIDYEYLLKLAELYGTTVEQLVNGRPVEKMIDYHRPSEQAKASEPEEISKKMLRYALWGSDSGDMTSEDVEAVLNYAEFLRQKKRG